MLAQRNSNMHMSYLVTLDLNSKVSGALREMKDSEISCIFELLSLALNNLDFRNMFYSYSDCDSDTNYRVIAKIFKIEFEVLKLEIDSYLSALDLDLKMDCSTYVGMYFCGFVGVLMFSTRHHCLMETTHFKDELAVFVRLVLEQIQEDKGK